MEQKQVTVAYAEAVRAIKEAILESRYRAARLVNKEVLALYYAIGGYISVQSRAARGAAMLLAPSLNCCNRNCLVCEASQRPVSSACVSSTKHGAVCSRIVHQQRTIYKRALFLLVTAGILKFVHCQRTN